MSVEGIVRLGREPRSRASGSRRQLDGLHSVMRLMAIRHYMVSRPTAFSLKWSEAHTYNDPSL